MAMPQPHRAQQGLLGHVTTSCTAILTARLIWCGAPDPKTQAGRAAVVRGAAAG